MEQLDRVAEIAREIQRLANTGGQGPYIRLSGREPIFRHVDTTDLLVPDWASRLQADRCHRLGCLLQSSLRQVRDAMMREFHNTTQSLASLADLGLSDRTLEASVARAFEAAYERHLDRLGVVVTRALIDPMVKSLPEKANGFCSRTTSILDTSFRYTQNPTVSEIDHLARITGLKTHQVRTWFQNKRNRRAKQERLRIASGSAVQGPTQSPVNDGRRVASLPSRARKAPPQAAGGGRVTRPLPRRNQANDGVPLVRTASHDSDSTTFSWSSIPSNGGFTGFQYPTATDSPNPTITFGDSTFVTPSDQPTQTSYFPSPASILPSDVAASTGLDLSPFMLKPTDSPIENQESVDFEQWLNFNLDALARPVDLTSNFDAEIQAALRPMDPNAFDNFNLNLNLTLAPSPLGSGSTSSPVSDFSAAEWVPELSPEEAESMEMLKVYLDGLDFVASPLDGTLADHSSPIGSNDFVSFSNGESQLAQSVLTQSPVDTFSGRTSPYGLAHSESSLDFEELPVSLDFDAGMDMEMDEGNGGVEVGCSSSGVMEKADERWVMGALPFDLLPGEAWVEA